MLSARRLLLSASQSARQPAAHKLVCPPAAMWRHDRRTAALSPLVDAKFTSCNYVDWTQAAEELRWTAPRVSD